MMRRALSLALGLEMRLREGEMMMLGREEVDKAGNDDAVGFECTDAAHEAEGRWSGRGVCCCKDW